MAAPASQYKDRQFLAVIGDEVRFLASCCHLPVCAHIYISTCIHVRVCENMG